MIMQLLLSLPLLPVSLDGGLLLVSEGGSGRVQDAAMLEVAAAANADMSAVAPGIRVEGQIDDGGHLHVVVAKKAVVHVGGVMIDD